MAATSASGKKRPSMYKVVTRLREVKRECHQLMPKHNHLVAFNYQLQHEPDKVIGIACVNSQLLFHVRLTNAKTTIMQHEVLRNEWPHVVIEFFEARLKVRRKNKR